MANTYPAITAYLSPSLTPKEFNVEGACDLIDLSQKEGSLPTIYAASRQGWIGAIIEVFARELNIQHMSFLYGRPWQHPWGHVAYLLRQEDLLHVASDISKFFAKIAASEDECSKWLESDSQEVLAALISSESSSNPIVDDGDQPISLFAYLKTLAQYCDYASKNGGALLHVQFDGG